MIMLQTLHVRDFAIIEEVDIELGPDLTVLTGETGTGKSILLGALQLLLGDRASADLVRQGAPRSTVQGTFLLSGGHAVLNELERLGVPSDDGVLIARREVSSEGRSRAFLNDRAVTVGALKEVGEVLVDLHGQHEHQSLLHAQNHLFLLDAYGGLTSLREAFAARLAALNASRIRLGELRERIANRAEKMELFTYQLREIDALDPKDGEIESLEGEIRILEGAERLGEGIDRLLQTLSESDGAVIDRLDQVEGTARDLVAIDPGLGDAAKLLSDARLSIQELVHMAQRYLDDFEFDQERLDAIRARHSALILLTRKYGGTMEALQERRKELREALTKQEEEGEELPRLESEVAGLESDAATAAIELSERRSSTTDALQERVEEQLHSLAMPDAVFRITVERRVDPAGPLMGAGDERYEAGPTGIDRVEFQLSTNPGGPVLPLQRVASGGEVSRIMLAIKSVFGNASQVPTLVFDEIDNGIGGKTADLVGEKLASLASGHQVVAITHLPQIARRGARHLVVEKHVSEGSARTRIREVDGDERTRALTVLMGGDEGNEALLDHARELLGVAEEGDSTQ
jgi:DNA repair protein RecN (Recombination protein N)